MFGKLSEALDYVGGLSNPSKMPCHAYSIPAQECGIGKIMRGIQGSVCSKCYALKGRYVFPKVKAALYRRFNSLRKEFWIDAMVYIIEKRKMSYFRWHDSGDLQGVWHLANIVEIAIRCPSVKFWLPTREAKILTDYMEDGGMIPSNLTVRVSGTMIDGKPPIGLAEKFNFGVSSVSVNEDEINCHSYKNQGKCGDCRACWDKSIFNIVYKKH